MPQVCPLFQFYLCSVEKLVEKRRETDGRYPRIQYTPIYRFSGHQPYVPIPPFSFLFIVI
jgi:hypothetical protein